MPNRTWSSARITAASLAVATALAWAALLVASPVGAQHEHGHAQGAADAESREATPGGYADLLEREIKALGPEEVEALLGAEGMGLALAAELNGYPGPRHVLDLAGELDLSARQRREVGTVHARMRGSALELGERLVAAERELDRSFAEGEITPAELDARTEEIGRLAARLRATHLRAHLETTALLDAEQIVRYARARGYSPQ